MNKRRQGLLGGGNEGRRESVNTIMNKMRNEEQINMYLIVVVRTCTTLNYEHAFFYEGDDVGVGLGVGWGWLYLFFPFLG